MQLTSFTDYGIRVLMYLATQPEQISSVKEIAEYYNISRNHLAKIIHRLSQLGYINTSKGKGGGIQISKGIEKLNLGEIIIALEPNFNIVECFDAQNNTCRITNSCQFKHYISEARENFINTMNKYTLGDTIQNKKSFFV